MNRTWESPHASAGAVSAATIPANPRAERRDNLIGRVIVPDTESAKPGSKLVDALAELVPAERALLDLSLRKGFSDAKLAELSGTDEPAVATWRTSVIGAIAREVDLDTPAGRSEVERGLRAAPAEAWLGRTGGFEEEAPKRRRPRRALVLVAALAAAIAAVLLISRGGSNSATSTPASTSPQPTASHPGESTSAREGGAVAMAPLAGAIPTGGATARITGKDSLEVNVEGLPSPGTGAYRLWLFNSVLDSTPIGSLRSGSGAIATTLPGNAAKYRYLDLTREQSPTDRLYSGIVILRLPVQSLLAPGG